jgi:two-component system, NarL family, invasion response regulator UvrY
MGRFLYMAADPERARPVGVVTVDDQAVFRSAAREVIEATGGFTSVGEAASGREALALVDECEPELVLVDVRMPGMNGIETTRRIKSAHPGTVVVLVSIEDPDHVPAAARSSGAVALVRKKDFGPAMLRDIWHVHGN